MGNIISDEDNVRGADRLDSDRFLDEGFNLDSPEADKHINYGTAAPNWQPKHTMQEVAAAAAAETAIPVVMPPNGAMPTTSGGGGGGGDAAGAAAILTPSTKLNNGNGSTAGGAADSSDNSNELTKPITAPSSLSNKQRRNNGPSSPSESSSASSSSSKTSASGEDKQENTTSSSAGSPSRRGSSSSSGSNSTKRQQQQDQDAAAASSGAQQTSNDPNAAAGSKEQQQQKKVSYIQMAKMGYQELINAIIRPPRADYKMEALGPPAFNFCGKRFTRTDFTLRTKRGYNLECSHWEPVERATDRIPVVIYMHGNSSARVEVIPQLSYLLSLGLAVFAFDFAGSGKSDGEYVSLGYYEREDLSCIVAHLRATNVVSTIALWGRSMGAATALMFGDRDPSIACMILDSPFADLAQLCEEMVEKGREQGLFVPNFVVNVALRVIQGSVKKQAGFNIKRISPISHADKCFIPALFVAGEHDDFIKKHHSEQLYDKYAGDKNLIVVEGDHNSPRPKFMFDSASIFLQTCLQIPNQWALQVPVSMNLMCPPWYFEVYQQRALRKQQAQAQQEAQAMGAAAATSNNNGTTVAAHRAKMNNNGSSSEFVNNNNSNGAVTGSGSSAAAAAAATTTNGTGNGYDHEEMGMTAERQRIIQASLFKMLGQADSGNTSNNTGATTDNNNADGNKSPSDQQQQDKTKMTGGGGGGVETAMLAEIRE